MQANMLMSPRTRGGHGFGCGCCDHGYGSRYKRAARRHTKRRERALVRREILAEVTQ